MDYPVKLDSWVKSILVDPLSKAALICAGDEWRSDYGRAYPIIGDIADLRVLPRWQTSADGKIWAEGQQAYESWSDGQAVRSNIDYRGELEGVRDVYQAIPVVGRCLDVGGHQGRLRAFLAPEQQYVVLDPFLHVFDGLKKQSDLLAVYPFLLEPVNFLCGVAEHLPFASCSFDTVHMRSVIDHFRAPDLALLEAYRVLKNDGQLIIGIWVDGGRQGQKTVREVAKEAARSILSAAGIHKFDDHHVWHPTYQELLCLIDCCGFDVAHVHWQAQWGDRVCYIRAIKRLPFAVVSKI